MPDSQNPKIHWPYRKLRHHPLLKKTVEKLGPFSTSPPTGWGYKPSGNSARKQAAKSKTSPLILEDAFIRSMKPGTGQVYGLVADSRGIYYDSSGKSDLIHALNTGKQSGWMRHTPDHSEISIPDLISHFCKIKASKYNWYPGDFSSTKRPENPGILIVDQTKGDTALTHGAVLPTDFDRMVRHALDEHPDKPIYLRSHPDHNYRGKHSCFSPWVFKEKRIKLLPSDLSPAECFEFCQEIYTATSLMGMEALLHGKTVKTYGWNFYAGWGLTQDRCKNPHTPRQRTITRDRLFEAAYLEYSHYFDPDTGQPCSLSRILQHLELQRKIATENSGTRISVSWDPWKKNLAENFFHTPANTLIHAEKPEIAQKLASKNPAPKLILWGARPEPKNNKTPILRIPVIGGFHTNFKEYLQDYRMDPIAIPVGLYQKWFHGKLLKTIVPSPGMSHKLTAEGFTNVEILGRGVDTRLFTSEKRSDKLRKKWGADENTPIAIVVGRVSAEKNIQLAIRAFARMRKIEPKLIAIVIGNGPICKKLARAHPEVHFPGYSVGQELAECYASADILLFPSETETFGNVTLEAMASGLRPPHPHLRLRRRLARNQHQRLPQSAQRPRRKIPRSCRNTPRPHPKENPLQKRQRNRKNTRLASHRLPLRNHPSPSNPKKINQYAFASIRVHSRLKPPSKKPAATKAYLYFTPLRLRSEKTQRHPLIPPPNRLKTQNLLALNPHPCQTS